MKLYELKVVDETDEVFAISLVESPAIQSDFIYFNKDEVQFANVETEKKMLVGPILIPDRKIVRIDGEGQPYHVFFSKDTVKKLAQDYLMKKYTDKATLEHDKKIKGVHLVESWIKEGKLDKSNSYGLNMPEGTWMGIFKVNDDKIWTDYVKTGKVKGFSVEALVEHELVKASLQMNTAVDELEEQEAALILSEIKYLIKKDSRYKGKKRVDMESYSDYGEGVKNNAKRAVEWAEKNGWGSCGTPVGKIRASQLAKGEAISVDTIKRMHSFLSRHEVDLESSKSFGDGCGYLMYQAWGGKAGKAWARGKLRELGLLTEAEALPSIPGSTYPGEKAEDIVAPALLEDVNVEVYGYKTKFFQYCPGAQALFQHLLSMPLEEDEQGMISSAALIADKVFEIEANVLNREIATPQDLGEAITLVKNFKDIIHEVDEEVGMVHDVAFMDGHIQKIKSFLK